jgi:hypothetical protein
MSELIHSTQKVPGIASNYLIAGFLGKRNGFSRNEEFPSEHRFDRVDIYLLMKRALAYNHR